MTVLSIILGVILVFCGFSCMVTPLATLLYTGYFIGIMLLFYGISGIVRGFMKQAHVLEVVCSVVAVIVGLISLVRPGSTLIFDAFIIYFIAIWFVIQGIISIALSLKVRKVKKTWILGLIFGILGVALGIYSFVHPLFAAVTAGILIGFYFVDTGFSMIMLASVADAVMREAVAIENAAEEVMRETVAEENAADAVKEGSGEKVSDTEMKESGEKATDE